MFNGLNLSTVTDYKLGSQQVNSVYYGSQLIWPQGPTPPHDYSLDYLTIVSLENDNLIGWYNDNDYHTAADARTISVSTDNGLTWTNYTSAMNTTIIATLNIGDKLLIKGNNTQYGSNTYINSFVSSKDINVEGNIMSLIYGDNFVGQTTLTGSNNFSRLFEYNGNIISAENLILPATTLTNSCYSEMFSSTSLEKAPVLPATTLAIYCYDRMFQYTSITTPPILPATTLAQFCYNRMFAGCPFLTTAPELPATTLTHYCYYNMFSGCTSLNYIKCLATNISASNCTSDWVYNVSSSGTFYKDANTTWSTGDSGIPSGWTTVNI